MKTLHWYLTRQVAANVLVAVAVFAFVLLLGNVLKEILSLLVNGQATLGTVFKVILLLIPYVLVFALPMGLLTATLLVFGRFSADQELTAMRSSGVSLLTLVTPILLLAGALSVLSGLVNLWIAPQCRLAYKSILRDNGMKQLGALLQENTFTRIRIKSPSGDGYDRFIVYIGDIDQTRTNLEQITIYQLDREGEFQSYYHASEGDMSIDMTNAILNVRLRDVWREDMSGGYPSYSSEWQMNRIELAGKRKRDVPLDEMNILQLFEQLREMEELVRTRKPPPDADNAQLKAGMKALRRDDVLMPVKVQIHRQFSFSFACIGFALLGIPLGIRAHRRETTFGIAVALALVLVYYSFYILGGVLEEKPEWAPHLILWIPNFIFQGLGALFLWRADHHG